jgi:hypothetical protein
MHSEALQHLGSGPESNDLALLLNGERRQKDGNQAVLPKRNAKFGIARDLKDELPIPSFVQELIRRESPHRQPAQDKRPRTEAKRLDGFFAAPSNKLNALCLLELLARNDPLWILLAKNGANTV